MLPNWFTDFANIWILISYLQNFIYDLAGVKLCSVVQNTAASGRFSATWDGRDDVDELLPPGLYLLRLEVQSDKTKDSRVATIPLIY